MHNIASDHVHSDILDSPLLGLVLCTIKGGCHQLGLLNTEIIKYNPVLDYQLQVKASSSQGQVRERSGQGQDMVMVMSRVGKTKEKVRSKQGQGEVKATQAQSRPQLQFDVF